MRTTAILLAATVLVVSGVLAQKPRDMSPAQFSITGNHPEHKAWKFYSCEITPLK